MESEVVPIETRIIESASPQDTRAAGRDIGRAASPATIVTLDGPLGAGKTVLAAGIAEGLEIAEWRGSPTFNIVHEYAGRLPMFHVDAYRITASELLDLDLARMMEAEGVIVVEWAANVAPALESVRPADTIRVAIGDDGADRRRIEIHR